MPASLPRLSSGIVWCQMTPRNKALTMSAAPATASSAIADQGPGAKPTSPMDAP